MEEWDYEKNKELGLTPATIGYGSNKKVWWFLSYDDPQTGNHFNFEWQTTIYNRVSGSGCPYLSNQAIWQGFNDLATTNPELVAEWHPTLNGNLSPEAVITGSLKKVWWYLPYDDSKTGKHFDFEWQATINNRIRGKGCPYLSNRSVWRGYNDLATTNPELVAEWHPTLNGDLKPEYFTHGSEKKIWWLLQYDDPQTGKHFDFEWQAPILNRTQGNGCPYLSGKAVWQGFNDLATINPEIAAEWHPTKNGALKPSEVLYGSDKKVWWFLSYDDPKTGKHFNFEWQATIYSRVSGSSCPYLSNHAVWQGYNDLASQRPDLLAEWHPTKNGNLKPENIVSGGKRKVWWLCKHGHEWQTSIEHRINGNSCPVCGLTGTSYSELALYYYISKIYPDALHRNKQEGYELDIFIPSINTAIEYDSSYYHDNKIETENKKDLFCKNKKIRLIRLRSNKLQSTNSAEIIWLNGENFIKVSEGIQNLFNYLKIKYDFEINIDKDYEKIVDLKIIKEKENSLAINFPDIAAEWHPTKNGNLTPEQFTYGSQKKVWWLGKCGHEWQAVISKRTSGRKCPYCSNKKVLAGYNDLATTHPELADEWHPTKNNGLKPTEVLSGSPQKAWWLLPYDDPVTGKHFDFEWEASIAHRAKGIGCPFLSNPIKAVWQGFNDLATTHPDLCKEWHPFLNDDLKPNRFTAGSQQKIWWLCPDCGHEWQSTISNRTALNKNCPSCKNIRR